MAITMEVERITPQIAARYLRSNIKNYRKISKSRVKQYADDMRNGRWELNGETIVFDKNGLLKNGQHRLAAIILADMPIEIMVVRGVDDTVTAFDIGGVRTTSQISNARGLDIHKNVLSAVNLLFSLNNNCHTQMKVVDYAEKHEDELNRAWRCMLNGEHTKNVKRASLMLAAYMMLKLQKMPFYELEVFFKAFSQNDAFGTDGYEVSPALVARKMFDERWKTGSCLRTQREQLDVVIQAMNDLHENKKRTNAYKISSPFAYEPLLKEMTERM